LSTDGRHDKVKCNGVRRRLPSFNFGRKMVSESPLR